MYRREVCLTTHPAERGVGCEGLLSTQALFWLFSVSGSVSIILEVDFPSKMISSVIFCASVSERDLEKERNGKGRAWKLQCARTLVADTQSASLKCFHRRSQLHTFSVSAAPNCPKFGHDVRRLAWMALALFFFGEFSSLERLSLSAYGTLPWISALASFWVLSLAQRGQERCPVCLYLSHCCSSMIVLERLPHLHRDAFTAGMNHGIWLARSRESDFTWTARSCFIHDAHGKSVANQC